MYVFEPADDDDLTFYSAKCIIQSLSCVVEGHISIIRSRFRFNTDIDTSKSNCFLAQPSSYMNWHTLISLPFI